MKKSYHKIEKSNSPAPGDYNFEKSIKKTQWHSRAVNFGKYDPNNPPKTKCFVDIAVKAKDYLPGVGEYKNIEKGYARLSTSPASIRRHR